MGARVRARAARALFPFLCAGLIFAFGGVVPPDAFAGGPAILGAGASFPQLEIDQWRADVARKPYQITVNYVSAGSTFGREQYIAGLVDFGVSDISFQPGESERVKRQFVYVPVSAGGVGFMYNLKDTSGRRITSLKLTPSTVCRIFSERGMFWDDPEVKALNPGLGLQHQTVLPVLRQDASGTGFVLSEYCIDTAPAVWRKFIETVKNDPVLNDQADPAFLSGQPTSRWPQFGGVSAFASDGVANLVASRTSGDAGITFVEAGFAKVRGFPVASVRNAAGVYTLPSARNVSRALAYARSAGDGTLSLAYRAPDKDVYFPSSYSYVIAPTRGFDPAKGRVLGTFLNYSVTLGQNRAEPLGYARLSSVIVNAALSNIQKIPGAPPKPKRINAPPPPVVRRGPVPSAPTGVVPTNVAVPTAAPGAVATQPGQPAAGPAPIQTLAGATDLASERFPTPPEALWTMIQGAALCALGIAVMRGVGKRYES